MNFQELKDIIQRDGGKIIIVENDKPEFVVMSFDEYRTKVKGLAPGPRGIAASPRPQSLSDSFDGRAPEARNDERSGLTIDDLPLS